MEGDFNGQRTVQAKRTAKTHECKYPECLRNASVLGEKWRVEGEKGMRDVRL